MLEMFDTFIGTLREKLKKMRLVIQSNYKVNISDPVQLGYRILHKSVINMIQLLLVNCCAEGYVTFVGRLFTSTTYPSCNKT